MGPPLTTTTTPDARAYVLGLQQHRAAVDALAQAGEMGELFVPDEPEVLTAADLVETPDELVATEPAGRR